jgi:hypothetical protein
MRESYMFLPSKIVREIHRRTQLSTIYGTIPRFSSFFVVTTLDVLVFMAASVLKPCSGIYAYMARSTCIFWLLVSETCED